VARYATCRDFLFGNYRDSRRYPGKRGQDDQFCCSICRCHGGTVALRLHVEPATHDFEDCRACLARCLREIVEEAIRGHAQRGAMRMPPSKRTAAAFI